MFNKITGTIDYKPGIILSVGDMKFIPAPMNTDTS